MTPQQFGSQEVTVCCTRSMYQVHVSPHSHTSVAGEYQSLGRCFCRKSLNVSIDRVNDTERISGFTNVAP